MQSLFDPVTDVELPPEKPKRNYKKLFKVLGLVVAVSVLGTGGYFGYRALFPPKLTERRLPPNEERLLTELKDARDDIDSQTRDIYARIEQFNQKMEVLGRKPVSFSQVFLQGLSAEEEKALDDMVRQERDPSYRGVLSKVVEDMKTIRDLQTKVAELESLLPDDGVEVKSGDTHLKLARTYLIEQHDIPETRAKELVGRINIMERGLQKGNQVYFFYDPARDFFGTWVSQGTAKSTPLAVTRARRMNLIRARDKAVARGDDLEEKRVALMEIKASLEMDIEELEKRKSILESNVAQLEGERNAALTEVEERKAELAVQVNSMFYEADLAERLKARGVLQVFNKVEQIGDVKFGSSIDLSQNKTITLEPSQFGIDRIRDLRIIPEYLREGRELDVQFIDDGTVEVTILNEDALRGQKVLFVLKR
jgi:hypothetical protein